MREVVLSHRLRSDVSTTTARLSTTGIARKTKRGPATDIRDMSIHITGIGVGRPISYHTVAESRVEHIMLPLLPGMSSTAQAQAAASRPCSQHRPELPQLVACLG